MKQQPKQDKKAKSKKQKRPVRMTRLMMERIKLIHFAIYSKTYPSAPKLARELEVTKRTVKRDIEQMKDRLGSPIEYDKSKKGYYYSKEVSAFPDILISESELISMTLANGAFGHELFGGLADPLSNMYEKMADSLPASISVNLGNWEQAISFHYIGEPVFDRAIFRRVIESIVTRKQLKLTYCTPEEEPAERVIDPYGMAFINREWVLFAYCHKRRELRRFIPPRMSAVVETGETFVRPEDFRVGNYLKDTFGVYCSDTLYDVSLRFTKKVAHETRERRWPEQHSIEPQPDGSVILRMKISHLYDIHKFILGFGGQIVPLGPKQLTDMYDQASEEMRLGREREIAVAAPRIEEPATVTP